MSNENFGSQYNIPLRREMPLQFFDKQNEKTRPASVTINRPVDQVFGFVQDPANLPHFIKHLKSVEVVTARTSNWEWEEKGKTEHTEFDIVAVEPDAVLVWKSSSTDGAGVRQAVMTFEEAPGGRGTVVSLKTSGEIEKGKVSGLASFFLGKDSKSQSSVNLRRLKAYLETGEVPTIEGQSNGRDKIDQL